METIIANWYHTRFGRPVGNTSTSVNAQVGSALGSDQWARGLPGAPGTQMLTTQRSGCGGIHQQGCGSTVRGEGCVSAVAMVLLGERVQSVTSLFEELRDSQGD